MSEKINYWYGSIPFGWNLKRLQWQLDEIKENNNPVKTDYILSLTNKLGVVPYSEKGNQGNVAKENLEGYKIAYPDTIVANSMNVLIGSVGYCKYYGCVSPVYYVFKGNGKSNIFFLNYIFQTEVFQKELRKYANGILEIRLRVSASDILKRKVPTPPLPIQNKIVEILDDKIDKIDALIANENKQIERLEQYKKAIITKAVSKGLDSNVRMKDSGIQWIGKIPCHWELQRVKNIGNTQNGISKSGDSFGKGYPFVAYGDVYKNYSLPEHVDGLIDSTMEERRNYSVIAGDIFFTRTSETIEEVGFSSVCEKTINDAVFAGFLIRLRPYQKDSLILTNFAKYYFRSELLRRYIVKEMNLVTRASLGQDLLKAMNVVLPSKNEQQQIADYLDEKCEKINRIIEIKKSKIEKLQDYKKSLIYEYVTGKKEVAL